MNKTVQVEGRFETTLSVNGPATLDVSVDSGFVRVRAGDAGSIQIRGILRARNSFFGWSNVEDRIRQIEAKPPVEQNGDTIRVGDVADRWLLRGVTLFLEIAVPADTRIRALADSGDLRVEGISAPIDCETDSGDIAIRQATGRIRAGADSGDIEVLDVAGDVEAATDSGDIRISQLSAAAVHAEADSGSITVKLAGEPGYNMSVRTDHGRITVPEMEWRTRSDQEAYGRLRGGGPVVDLETDSGDIDVA
jgi:Putative adhesin